ncbi:hypothetical protein WOLCODRAFT_145980 [Wolfiporia cocos MD-104 SS10]|uniref:Protein kinase domain-containing protein n=1 Tax=Wolfiporia cocos (strain MD-104) TaxID=742152 RepID=A0A2H3J2B8_WOLCO|nr:hypothetical protein WOLCODRAFT_145980 [Wolfiporia cocos MD-104 SS10]
MAAPPRPPFRQYTDCQTVIDQLDSYVSFPQPSRVHGDTSTKHAAFIENHLKNDITSVERGTFADDMLVQFCQIVSQNPNDFPPSLELQTSLTRWKGISPSSSEEELRAAFWADYLRPLADYLGLLFQHHNIDIDFKLGPSTIAGNKPDVLHVFFTQDHHNPYDEIAVASGEYKRRAVLLHHMEGMEELVDKRWVYEPDPAHLLWLQVFTQIHVRHLNWGWLTDGVLVWFAHIDPNHPMTLQVSRRYDASASSIFTLFLAFHYMVLSMQDFHLIRPELKPPCRGKLISILEIRDAGLFQLLSNMIWEALCATHPRFRIRLSVGDVVLPGLLDLVPVASAWVPVRPNVEIVVKHIADGGYASAWRGMWMGKSVVFKIAHLTTINELQREWVLVQELQRRKLDLPIPHYYGIWSLNTDASQQTSVLIMDDVGEAIRSDIHDLPSPLDKAYSIAYSKMVNARVIPQDLHSGNVVVDREGHVWGVMQHSSPLSSPLRVSFCLPKVKFHYATFPS